MKHGIRQLVLGLAAVCLAAGCNPELLENQTAPLGGTTPGETGSVQVAFINNTPHRVVFTAGTYNQLDQFTQPDFFQFSIEPSGTNVLNANESSDILVVDCGKVMSIGGTDLLSFISQNLPDADFNNDSFVAGAAFYDVDPDTGDATDLIGSAPSTQVLLGVDFPCNALLIFRFEFADHGDLPFRTSFQVIPSASDR